MKKGKKRLGRPPIIQTGFENGPKKPGRGRKPKRGRQPLNRNKRKSDDSEEMLNGDTESVCGSIASVGHLDDEVDSIMYKVSDGYKPSPYKKRKYQRKVVAPSDIKTRGIKLPSYSTAMCERRPRSLKIKDLLPPENEPLKKRGRKPKINELQMQAPQPRPISGQILQPMPVFKGETMLQLKSNPLYWSTEDVINFIKETDSAQFARIIKEQV